MTAGFLKSNRGLFRLGPKITTVGREGCDLVIQSADVDQQHAILEYSEVQRCFILQDLNTANGTYVNDCRVQNAAVRLAPGDVVRFGLTSLPYELVVEFPGDPMAKTIESTQTWQPIQNSVTGPVSSSSFSNMNQVQVSPPAQPRPAWQTFNIPRTLPQPTQTLRSRPLSAESLLQRQKESPPILLPGNKFSNLPASEAGKTKPRKVTFKTSKTKDKKSESKSTNSRGEEVASNGSQTHRVNSPTVSNAEQELARRDAIVNQFRDEINELKQRLQHVLTATAGGQVDLVQRYCQLETELSSKALEASALREQVTRLRLQGEGPVHYKQELSERVQELQNMKSELERIKKDKNITSGLLSQVQRDLAGKDTTISRLTREIENLKRELREKDVQLSSLGSKPMSSQPTSPKTCGRFAKHHRLNTFEEGVSTSNRGLSGYSTAPPISPGATRRLQGPTASSNNTRSEQFQKMKELKNLEEEREARDKELISLREQFKLAENRLQQQLDEIAGLKSDLDKHKREAIVLRDNERNAVKDLEKLKEQVSESQRLETQTRADLRSAEAKLERLRSRTVQLLSTSGQWATSGAITDEALIDQLVKVIDAEAEARRKLKTANEDGIRTGAKKERESIASSISKFTSAAAKSEVRLMESKRTLRSLQIEFDFISTIGIDDEIVLLVKNLIVDSVNNQLAFTRSTIKSLQDIGVETEENSDMIEALLKRLENDATAIKELNAKIKEIEENTAETLRAASERASQEMEELKQKHVEELQKAIQDSNNNDELSKSKALIEQLQKQLSETTQQRDELQASITSLTEQSGNLTLQVGKLEEDLKNEKAESEKQIAEAQKKVAEAEKQIAEANSKIAEAENQIEIAKKEAEEAHLQRTQSKSELEASLRAQIEELNKKLLAAERNSTGKRRSSEDLGSYKEQIRQHAKTIDAMEEKISKLSKKNKEYSVEVDRLNKEVAEWKMKAEIRPVSPVHRKTGDPALEEAVNVLKKENMDLRAQIAQQQQKISSLQRDLTGAAARLSDMTGELSEAQKMDIERSKQLAEKRGSELEMTREQLAKLSAIVDKLKAESEALRAENTKLKHDSEKFTRDIGEREKMLHDLREELNATHGKMRQQVEKIEDEAKNRSDLLQLGMQCRGERHEQIVIRQREALAELRTRIRQLEQNKLPIIPTTDAAFHQIQMLKKEVADLRTSQALTESQMADDMQAGDPILNSQRMVANYEAQLEAEKTATRELRRTVEKSEFTYSDLASAVACNLELDQVIGNRTIADLPPDEQDKVCAQRRDFAEAAVTRIRQANDRVNRKDELLKNYEVDLTKISQLKELTGKKEEQIKQLLRELRGKIEENDFLRESLERTKSRFEQEKRLNTAVKSKKTFHLENDSYFNHSYPKHSCTTSDPRVKVEQRKRNEGEKMKKKQYEVASLKIELDDRQRQLDETTLRLHQLQSGLGPVSAMHDSEIGMNGDGDLSP